MSFFQNSDFPGITPNPQPTLNNMQPTPAPTPEQTAIKPDATHDPTYTPTPSPTAATEIAISVFGSNPNSELLDIDWGAVVIGEPKNYTTYVLNRSNQPVILSLSVTNWTPEVDGKVTWDYNGKALSSQDKTQVTLSLIIYNTNVTSFSNVIRVIAQADS